MKLKFLGTCACDFSPRLKDECADRFDLDARRSSCALLDGHILIDCGIHALDSLRIAQIPTENITDIFITHLHGDHYRSANIAKIAEGRDKPLHLWVSEEANIPEIMGVTVHKMKKLCQYETDGYNVTGLYANHDMNSCPQHLLFEKNGKKMLYATDGAWFINTSYNFLKNASLDLLVIDATCGDYEGDFRMAEHNSIPMIRMMLPSLKTFGILREDSEVYLTHIAPSLHKPHKETVEIVKPMGVKVAYDGLEIKI